MTNLRQANPSAPSTSWLLTGGWNRFWFSPADPTVLGLIRICCGLIALYVHLLYSFQLQALFGAHAWFDLRTANEFRRESPTLAPPAGWQEEDPDDLPDDPEERARILDYRHRWGVDPRQTVSRGQYLWSIWYHVTEPTWMAAVHGLYLLILVLFTLGAGARITSVLAWLGALSYINRATIAYGLDVAMNVTLFYLMIGPSGAALSADRLLARWWTVRRARSQGLPEPEWLSPALLPSANFAIRLIQVHLCIIYLVSGLSKLQGAAWWNGTASWLALATYEFSLLRFEFYQDVLRFLTRHRWLWEIVMTASTWFTLFVEIGFPFLIWHPSCRWPMLVAALLLHLGIGLFMGLMTFSLMYLTMVLSFVPISAVHQMLSWCQTLPRRLSAGFKRAHLTNF